MQGSAPQLSRVQVLDTPVTVARQTEAEEFLAGLVAERRGGYLCNANVFSLMLAHDDLAFRAAQDGAALVMADGMPIVWLLRLLGHPADRVHGDDFFLACAARFPDWRHFFVGGAAGQAPAAASAARARFPGLLIAGARSTPRRPMPPGETERIVAEIRAARADVVWVGMGTPAQDLWMRAASPRLAAPMVGVGSLFDLLTGRTRAAPDWVKRAGLQWLLRLTQEPRRLGRRYLVQGPRFAWHLTRALRGTQPKRRSA